MLDLVDAWGPEKIVCVSDPRTGMKGCLVIDNTARGMGKGGTRMSPIVTVEEVARLARVMTWKWAGVDLSFGGAKAGIVGDPHAPDKERILRAWARALARHIPAEYVLGLDMGLTERDAAVVQDELGDRGAAVGSPSELGGVPYDELGLTGFGVAEAADAACQVNETELRDKRVVIQGFGAVGHAAAKRFGELGAVVTTISTVGGALHDPDGLNVDDLLALRHEVGDDVVHEYRGGRLLAAGDELTVSTDVLVPAAQQDVISATLAREIEANIVVEGANLPTSPEAQDILMERGVTVVPDFIANAGAVVGAGVAMDTRYSAFRADPNEIFELISEKLRTNTALVLERAATQQVKSHDVALALAQERVHTAMELKGRVPERELQASA